MKRKKLLLFTAVLLLSFILLLQLEESRDLYKTKKILEKEIAGQQKQNVLLEKKFSAAKSLNTTAAKNEIYNLKEATAQILTEIRVYNLELIDFSSGENELNLNLQGEFKSILRFIYYLESELNFFEIVEFKIRDNSRELFFFLKLKNELI